MKSFDLKSRSFLKAVSYRIVGTLVSISIAFFITKRIDLSLGVGAADVMIKIALFYFHERLWNIVPWGKKNVEPAVIWFSGLSGAGKTTLAEKLFSDLKKQDLSIDFLDGDAIRDVFTDRGFKREERRRHIKIMGFMASHLEKSGTIVIASFITPYEEMRDDIKKMCQKYIEVYVSTPLHECEKRDVKGLYKKARAGEISHFTGISDAFEVPVNPHIELNTYDKSLNESYEELKTKLIQYMPDLKEHLRS